MLGALGVLGVLVAAAMPGALASPDAAPSLAHPLGTDAIGRDVALRLLAGGRPLVVGGGVALAVALGVGVPVGALGGTRGGWLARGTRGAAASLGSLPGVPLVLLLGLVLGHGEAALGAAWGAASAPGVVQAVYQRVDRLRREDRLLALTTHGVPAWRALAVHLVWHGAADVLRAETARVLAAFVAMEAALSYLGRAGVDEPAASWGNMLAMAMASGSRNPAALLAPAAALAVTSVALWARALGTPRARPKARPSPPAAGPLEVDGLTVRDGATVLAALPRLTLAPGQVGALVGPSGAGKSLLLRAIAGVPPAGLATAGTVRRPVAAWIAQDAPSSLDPLRTVAAQTSPDDARLAASGFPAARLGAYPHELSGGEAQRAALLLAVSPEGPAPGLLLADEPTTGLDPLARRALTAALRDLSRAPPFPAVLFVTHDHGLLPGFADPIVAVGPDARAAAAASPVPRLASSAPPLVQATALDVWPGLTRRPRQTPDGPPVVRALDLEVRPGQTVALVGASGCGKTSVLRALRGLCASRGGLRLAGVDPRDGRPPDTQLLWQDARAALDPALPLARALEASARIGGGARTVAQALARVDLTGRADARPDELSGGEARRASIAQVWLAGARVVLADEPTAGLDAARADQALDLLRAGVDGALLIATHDLARVLPRCDRVYVLLDGACVDAFTPGDAGARHPYTLALLAAG